MSNTDQLGAFEYEAETGWAENIRTFATHRPPILDPLDITSLTQDAIDPERVVMQLQGGTQPITGPKGGSFKTRMWLPGHGVDTNGAVTIDAIETYLGHLFGNPSLGEANSGPTRSAPSATTAAGGSTTTNVVTVASGTIAKGSLVKLGTAGLSADARGGGQFYPVASHVLTALALRAATGPTAAPAALNAGDIVRPAVNLYLPETVANTAVKGLRHRWLTGNQRYEMHGCWPMSFSINGTNPAELPLIEADWGVSWWDSAAAGTLPSSVTQNQYNPAPNGGGSFACGDVGSTVRTTYDVRTFSVQVNLGMVPLPGHGGVDPYQRYVGARRVPSKVRFSFTVDAEATGTHIWEDKYLAGTPIWIINTLSATPGSSVCIYLQNCKIDKRPKQVSVNGINSIVVEGYACAGTDVSTDLSQAALVVGLA